MVTKTKQQSLFNKPAKHRIVGRMLAWGRGVPGTASRWWAAGCVSAGRTGSWCTPASCWGCGAASAWLWACEALEALPSAAVVPTGRDALWMASCRCLGSGADRGWIWVFKRKIRLHGHMLHICKDYVKTTSGGEFQIDRGKINKAPPSVLHARPAVSESCVVEDPSVPKTTELWFLPATRGAFYIIVVMKKKR